MTGSIVGGAHAASAAQAQTRPRATKNSNSTIFTDEELLSYDGFSLLGLLEVGETSFIIYERIILNQTSFGSVSMCALRASPFQGPL